MGVFPASRLTDHDIYLFKSGNHFQLYNKLGAHVMNLDGTEGVYFAVWAPNARVVSVIGNFNQWNRDAHILYPRWDSSGIWEGFIPEIGIGDLYKYFIVSYNQNYCVEKSDPYGYMGEVAPQTASKVWDLDYQWEDAKWMKIRKNKNAHNAPMSIYEIHLGSWRRKIEEGNRSLTYRELAEELIAYIKEMGFTHIEFMPIMEHPFYGSWGYQTLGYFSPTSRYGTPQDLMYLIDQCHQNDIGVLLDWVPSHFPSDEHGLSYFDGTHVFEHEDPQKAIHPDWDCYVFNNGRNEIKEFLISSALFWLEKYHVDGLRVDAVASMLYLDYSRKDGQWTPNIYGGNDDLESVAFIRQLNEVVYGSFPDIQMIAEESTAWSKVSRPTVDGGLGFGMKWNMGWMHDTLEYFKKDPVHRKFHHNELTFSMLYAYTENFILSLSHDEVVHGKGSLVGKMPNDDWQKIANLRLLFGYMYAHPGKKLLFMGAEFAQFSEWSHEASLDWHLLEQEEHGGMQNWMKALNHFYRKEPAFYLYDFEPEGFEWINTHDWEISVLSFMRKGAKKEDDVVVVCNFTPATRDYRLGLPYKGTWKEVLNSDDKKFGGAGNVNSLVMKSEKISQHARENSIMITLPPLGVAYFKPMIEKEISTTTKKLEKK